MMILDKFALTGKVGIVTGSGSHIGKGIALGFAEAGADVVVAEINPEWGEVTAAEIRVMGRKALSVPTDVRSSEQITKMIKATVEAFGRIDILVNNAAFQVHRHIMEISEEEWDSIMDTDLKAVFLCSRAAGEQMIRQKSGVIINISSVRAFIGGGAETIPYSAAKAGIGILTRGFAQTLAAHHIRVNAIAPGRMARRGGGRSRQVDSGSFERQVEMTLMGRLGEPVDIAAAAVYLASDASSWVTGTTLIVDGGLTAYAP